MSIASEIGGTTAPRALIPRRVLFSNPDRINPVLSPDGITLAYAAPHEGVMNVWTRPVDGSAPARPVTADRGRGITEFTLCAGDRLVYAQDTDGDESWRLYVLDLASGQSRLVTPERGVQARVLAYRPDEHPDRMLVAVNADHPGLHDVYELHLPTGKLTLIEENPGHDGSPPFTFWLADTDLNIRGGAVPTPDGGLVVHIRDDTDGPYRPLINLPGDDLGPNTDLTFTRDGSALIMVTSFDAPATRLARIDPVSAQITTIASDPRYDLTDVWWNASTLEPVVAIYAPDRAHYDVLDPAFTDDVERLTELDDGDVTIVDSACAGRLLLAAITAPHRPIRYYLYDRDTGEARFLFPHREALTAYRLASMEPFQCTARDGLDLHGYLTLPVDAPDGPLPAVVLVHGGPWDRDYWRFHPEVQLLADRGYAVIQVNYRGSSGYGKAHMNAGNGQWGRAMQDDLIDAVDYLARQGVIDAGRVGIYGASYGGYAALCGAAFHGEVFRCAASACGPTDVATLITSLPPYALPMIALYHARVGHPEHDADRLREVSPLAHAAGIGTPLLIAQGAQDPRVPQAQADELVAALPHGVAHRYLLFKDEGHGLVMPANRETFYAALEKFFATHLGGACEDPSDELSAIRSQP